MFPIVVILILTLIDGIHSVLLREFPFNGSHADVIYVDETKNIYVVGWRGNSTWTGPRQFEILDGSLQRTSSLKAINRKVAKLS